MNANNTPPLGLNLSLRTPKPFSGDRQELRDFIFLCNRTLKIFNIAEDETKISFVGSCLEGLPLTWYRNTVRVPISYDDFMKKLVETFGQTDIESYIADAKLKQITQGTRSVRDYTTEFEQLIFDSTYYTEKPVEAVEIMKGRMYLRGLHQDILLAIAAGPDEPPTEYEKAKAAALTVEERLRKVQSLEYSDEP